MKPSSFILQRVLLFFFYNNNNNTCRGTCMWYTYMCTSTVTTEPLYTKYNGFFGV